MNKNSGMLGLTGTSNDMREILAEAGRGGERHRLAIEIYCYRIRKYIGAYMAVLGGVDAIVFTGGIGENAAPIREVTLKGMDSFGISVDPKKNAKHQTDIGTGSVRILVIPTNEELAIGRDTAEILRQTPKSAEAPRREAASPDRSGKTRPAAS
jgi:acetate kinase